MRYRLVQPWTWLLFTALVIAQAWYSGFYTRGLRAAIEEMPPAPTATALKAISFGDDEFAYRYLARWLQDVGDGNGRIRPLRDYDYDRVVGWLEALDELNRYRSDYTPSLAARYFAAITPEVDIGNRRVFKIFDYLRRVGLRDPARKWRWLLWDANTARRRFHDNDLVKELARDLESPEMKDPSVPAWVRLIPIRLYYMAGDRDAAEAAYARASPEDLKAFDDMVKAVNAEIRRGEGEAEPQPPKPARPAVPPSGKN